MRLNTETLELFDSTDLDAKLIEAHYKNAVGYLKIGEIELASQAARRTLKIDADHPPTRTLLELIKQEYFINGLTLIKENKISEGIRSFQSAVTIDSTFVDAYCEIGRAFLRQGKLDEAEKAAKKVLRLDSGSESAHEFLEKIKRVYCKRARTYLRQGKFTSAEKAIGEVLRLDSDYELAHELLERVKCAYYDQGIAFLRQNQYDKAIASFESALAIDNGFLEAHCEIVRAYLRQGMLKSAEDAIRKVLRFDSSYGPAYTLLSEIKDAYYNFTIEYLKQGKFSDVEKMVKELSRLDASGELLLKIKDVYCDRGRGYLSQGKFEFAKKAVKGILRLDSSHKSAHKLLEEIKHAYYERGCVCFARGDFEAAEEAINEILGLDSSYELAYQLLKEIKHIYKARGTVFLNEKQDEKANSDFQKSDMIDASFTETDLIKAYCQLGDFYLQRDELDRAHVAITEILYLDSDYGPVFKLLESLKYAYYNYGRMCLNQGKLEDAGKAINDALRLDADYWYARELLEKLKHVYYDRVFMFLSEDQYNEAITSFEGLLAIDPDFAEVKWGDVLTCLGQGDLAAAEKMVREILEFGLDYWFDLDYEFSLDYEFDLNYSFAPAILKKIKDIYYDQGIAFLEENQYNEAIANFENAIVIDMNFTAAYIGLQDAYFGQLYTSETEVEEVDIIAQAPKHMNLLALETESMIEATYLADETEDSKSLTEDNQRVLISWLQRVASYPLLTRAEEVELAKRIEAEEIKALDELLETLVKNYLLSREKKDLLVKRIEVAEDKALDGILDALVEVNLLSLEKKEQLEEQIEDRSRVLKMLVDEILGTSYLLTNKEKEKLAKRIAAAEGEVRSARSELAQANLRLVVSTAVKYQGHNVPLEDLIQEGNIGLIKAASKFDYRKGVKFSNYATWWIKLEIMQALDNTSRLIRLPAYFIMRMKEFDAVYERLCQELQREPRRTEIAEALNLTVRQIEEILISNIDVVSIDLPLDNECSTVTLGDLIEDPTTSEKDAPIAEMINTDLTAQFLKRLPEREQRVLKMRFGLEDGERKTFREIGVALEVTRERVRQLEIDAIKRLYDLYDEMGEFRSFRQHWV